jgi:molybdate transport system ATP-binding protein
MAQLVVDVRFRYGSGFEIEAKFEAGEGVTALFGPSGSGKTTILHLIAGVLQPADGTIRIGDRTLDDTKTRVHLPPEQRLVGIVFQDHLLFPHMSVRKNLLFGMGRRKARPMSFDKVVEILEIGEFLNRLPSTLSGGQRQRVTVGRALLRGPELLLLDEPLAALDHELKERVLAYLHRVFQEWRIPTLFVCHERNDVDRIADQVVSLGSGRVLDIRPTQYRNSSPFLTARSTIISESTKNQQGS